MTKNKELTTRQQRILCDICCRYEDSWSQGNRVPPEDFLSLAYDIDPEIVLQELYAIQNELNSRVITECHRELQLREERYTFIEEIARGGTAVVWRVRDRHLQRETAVKYLLDSNNNQQMRFRLEQEARLCARLTHPGIIPIYELSSFTDGRPFVSMKLVEGKTLQQLLEDCPPINAETVSEVFRKVCQTVAFAHDLGIVHRDLKPANIMVGSFEEVYVLDWGLGKDLNTADSDNLESPLPENSTDNIGQKSAASTEVIAERAFAVNTLEGTVFGTLPYMSPEQALGRVDRVDTRSDVFALGAILCRIITGAAPYEGDHRNELLRQAQNGDLQDAQRRLQLSPNRELAELAADCLSVTPNNRPVNAQAVVERLNQILDISSRRKFAKPSWLAVASLLFTLTIAAFVAQNPNRKHRNALHSADSLVETVTMEDLIPDPIALKALFRDGQNSVALRSYQNVLEQHPIDLELCRYIWKALMAAGRIEEAHVVAKLLMNQTPVTPEDTHLYVESLISQGKLSEAYQTTLEFQQNNTDDPNPFLLQDSLEWLKTALELSQADSQVILMEATKLSSGELWRQARMLEAAGRIDLAINLYRCSMDREDNPSKRSLMRHGMLIELVRKHLDRKATADAICDKLCRASIDLIREQCSFANEVFSSTGSSHELRAQATEIVGIFDRPDKIYGFLESALNDKRIASAIRADLAKAILEARTMLNGPSLEAQ